MTMRWKLFFLAEAHQRLTLICRQALSNIVDCCEWLCSNYSEHSQSNEQGSYRSEIVMMQDENRFNRFSARIYFRGTYPFIIQIKSCIVHDVIWISNFLLYAMSLEIRWTFYAQPNIHDKLVRNSDFYDKYDSPWSPLDTVLYHDHFRQ